MNDHLWSQRATCGACSDGAVKKRRVPLASSQVHIDATRASPDSRQWQPATVITTTAGMDKRKRRKKS